MTAPKTIDGATMLTDEQKQSLEWLDRVCVPNMYLGRLGPARDLLRALLSASKPAAPTNADDLKRFGTQMANTMFNLAQRPGKTLDTHMCEKFDLMRRQWDAAIQALAAAPAVPAQSGDAVAWRAPNLSGSGDVWAYRDADDRFEDSQGNLVGEPLYAAPQPSRPAQAGEATPKRIARRFMLDANIDGMDTFTEFVLASDHDEFVHDLETLCDPAGLVAENALLRDQTKMLDAMVGRLKERSAVVLDDERVLEFADWMRFAHMKGIEGRLEFVRAIPRAASPQAALTDAQMQALSDFIYHDMGSPSDWVGFDFNGARRALTVAAQPASGGDRD